MILQFRFLLSAGAALLLASTANAQNAAVPAPRDVFSDTWVATDALGRSMPTPAQTGPPRANKTVAIFYFPWLGNDPNYPAHDLTKMVSQNPAAPAFGGVSSFHWWGEPLFGYYLPQDPFIARKHAQMLSDSGVDVIIFDSTNNLTYPQVYVPLCNEFRALRAKGIKTPDIAFFPAQKAADQVWRDVYSKNLYSDLWFRWKGKPLLMPKPEVQLTPEMEAFFTVRRSWAWSAGAWFGDGKGKWPWLDHSPQRPGLTPEGDKEHISVSIAQHPTTSIGRSHQAGKQPPVDEKYLTPTMGQGFYFSEQWKRALEVDPEIIFLTGWNEWIAQRSLATKPGVFAGKPQKVGDSVFVDAFSEEFSRDAEPTKQSSGDNYFLQMTANIRRYKGARQVEKIRVTPIKIDGNFADWNAAAPEFRDTAGDEVRRDFAGWGGNSYRNNTGRNDILASKASYDARNLYFYARTQNPISAPDGKNWMLLYIDTDQNPKTGWNGFDFVVNHSGATAQSTTIRAYSSAKNEWGTPRAIPQAVGVREIEVAIPRWIAGNRTNLDFKWADNCLETGTWSDWTLNGDAAPNDRFKYRFRG